MPRKIETSANDALGGLLKGMLGKSEVYSESTNTIEGHSGRHPDILVTGPGRSPVVVEAEYEPARTVEAEARDRLGLAVTVNPRPIEAAIALRYPEQVADADDLAAAIASAKLSYCVFSVERYGPSPAREILSVARFPESGWLEGSVSDLAYLVRLVSVPQLAVDRAADSLQSGINRVGAVLDELEQSRPAINSSIARLLGMRNLPQTRRMAGAIIANAMVFHERIAGMHDNIKALNLVCGPNVTNPQGETLAAWTEILGINYWPIFAIGRDILQQLPVPEAGRILRLLEYTVGEVGGTGIGNAHGLTGRVFQRLIADRKYLATFYTLPASAALLARLAVAKLDGVDWSDADAIGRLRIGDFACGTGALLSAVYEQIAARHENAGGDPAAIHPVMMEEVLYGCDVMPSAVHLTGSTLSGIQPEVRFGKSCLYPMRYGRQEDGSVKIGSLEFLQSDSEPTLFNSSDPSSRTGNAGGETTNQVIANVPDEGFDLVIMNPPFTSNTKGYDADDGVVNAAFAAFDSSTGDQEDMAARMKEKSAKTCYHGHAGLASAFAALAHRKLKPGGVLALVLPFTAINGGAWGKFRQLVTTSYSDLAILSIAAAADHELSFSADTGMAECLVIARKEAGTASHRRGRFTSLRRRAQGFAHVAAIADAVIDKRSIRRLEDGPYGGTPLAVGDELAGESIEAPIDDPISGWGVARILDGSVAQVANLLSTGDLWLPAESKIQAIPMVSLNEIGQRGVDHQLFVSVAHKGPFIKTAPSGTATYPSLWNHDAKNETRIACLPDSQMIVRCGMEMAAQSLWKVASRSHITQEFRFTSQPLVVAITDQMSIGGRAWPNVRFPEDRFDLVFALWGNSTLGMLLFWWRASRQQSGRGAMTINGIETLPVLDFRALSDEQLAMAERIFEEFRGLELQPAYLADADANRALLDRRVVCDLLGFDEDVYRGVRRLAAKWCAEPSVHGGKARPKSAVYVE